MEISIITPYYETYEETIELAKILIPQLDDKIEWIIIDDGCNETRLNDFIYSDKFKKKWNYIKVWHSLENKGGAFATNEGIRNTDSKYVALIDSDDMVSDDYIETLLKAIDEYDEDVIIFDWQDMNTGEIMHRPHNYAPWKAIYKREIMPMFVEGWIYSYDVPFQEELAKKNPSVRYLDKVLYYYNSNRPGNLTLTKQAIIEGREKE